MTTKAAILKAIRGKCLNCCCGSTYEVRMCSVEKCKIHPFRLGADPAPSKIGFAMKPARQKAGDNDHNPRIDGEKNRRNRK